MKTTKLSKEDRKEIREIKKQLRADKRELAKAIAKAVVNLSDDAFTRKVPHLALKTILSAHHNPGTCVHFSTTLGCQKVVDERFGILCAGKTKGNSSYCIEHVKRR